MDGHYKGFAGNCKASHQLHSGFRAKVQWDPVPAKSILAGPDEVAQRQLQPAELGMVVHAEGVSDVEAIACQ